MFAEIEIELDSSFNPTFHDRFVSHFGVVNTYDETLAKFIIGKNEVVNTDEIGIEFDRYYLLARLRDNYIHVMLEPHTNKENVSAIKTSVDHFLVQVNRFLDKPLSRTGQKRSIKSVSVLIANDQMNSIMIGRTNSFKEILLKEWSNHKLRLFSLPISLFLFESVRSQDLKLGFIGLIPALILIIVHLILTYFASNEELSYE